jgi:hypothetical protein
MPGLASASATMPWSAGPHPVGGRSATVSTECLPGKTVANFAPASTQILSSAEFH